MSTPVILCCHCGTTIERATERGKGWRHSATRFLSCDPGKVPPTFAEPEPTAGPPTPATTAQLRQVIHYALLDALVQHQPGLEWRWANGYAGAVMEVRGAIDLQALDAAAATQILDTVLTAAGQPRPAESFDDL